MEQPVAPVRAWEEAATLPTYAACPAEPDPMFLEKSVYEGSSGKVYLSAITDRISETRSDQTYKAIHLENGYVRLIIPPEIGGRTHIGQDKQTDTIFPNGRMSLNRRSWDCWGRASLAVSNSIGCSTTVPPHSCLSMPRSKRRVFGNAETPDQNPATVRDSLTYKKVAVRCIYAAQYSGLLFICSPKHFVSD